MSVHAQSYTWGGTGSTTATPDYILGTNWSVVFIGPPPPPVLPGQAAVFGSTGSSTVNVAPGFVQPASWTFSANAQSYGFSGGAIAFSVAGPAGGIINNANAGQVIIIGNAINDGAVFPGPVAVPVMVQQLGNSTLVLTGANGYSGGTLISAGTVQVNNGSALGTGTVTLGGGTLQMTGLASVGFSNNFAVNAPGGTVDAAGAQVTLSGVISDGAGAGVLRLVDSVGTGFFQLTGVNTYSGGTLVNGTIVQVSNNNSVGTGTVTLDNGTLMSDGTHNVTLTNNFRINNNGAFNIIDAFGKTVTIAGNISDGAAPGQLTVKDTAFANSRVVLLGNNTYTGGTTICTCGTLQLGDPTHMASLVGDVFNEGTFRIVNANTSRITSIINTNGGITEFGRLGSADVVTAGSAIIDNSFSGGVFFQGKSDAGTANITNHDFGGTLFRDRSSAGSATITTNDNGVVEFFDRADGGKAQFITNGSGAVDFSGSTGPNGDHRINAGSIAGSGSYFIGVGNTLVVGGNNLSTNVRGVIADNCGCGPGSGNLEKVGSCTLILSGPNIYTGTTVVNGGVLDVEGSIFSSSLTTVNLGCVLTGAGIVGKTQIANGGIFLPGNGFGTSTQVQGNLAFDSGALYFVQLN